MSDHSKIDPELLEGDMIPQGKFTSADKLKERYQNPGDIDFRGVVVNMTLLAILFVGTFFALAVMMRSYRASQDEGRELAALSNRFTADPKPQGPLIQPDPSAEGRALIAAAKAGLEGYGWNDAEKTSAHIPIERAMAILAERGLPDVGTVDQFHPKPGSSGVPKVGLPDRPAAPAAAESKAEAPKPEEPKPEAKP